jgi:hypothetical protein
LGIFIPCSLFPCGSSGGSSRLAGRLGGSYNHNVKKDVLLPFGGSGSNMSNYLFSWRLSTCQTLMAIPTYLPTYLASQSVECRNDFYRLFSLSADECGLSCTPEFPGALDIVVLSFVHCTRAPYMIPYYIAVRCVLRVVALCVRTGNRYW